MTVAGSGQLLISAVSTMHEHKLFCIISAFIRRCEAEVFDNLAISESAGCYAHMECSRLPIFGHAHAQGS